MKDDEIEKEFKKEMEREAELKRNFIAAIIIILCKVLIEPYLVEHFWNDIIIYFFNLPKVTFWQSFIFVLFLAFWGSPRKVKEISEKISKTRQDEEKEQ